jgi:hypothetical protein
VKDLFAAACQLIVVLFCLLLLCMVVGVPVVELCASCMLALGLSVPCQLVMPCTLASYWSKGC